MMENSLCGVCGQKASLLCSACKSVCYCSKQHQMSHWKEHKLICSGKTYQIEADDSTGHHLVARKDLKPGTLILQEQPLMIGERPRNEEDKKVCIGCYQKLVGRGVDCPGCKWPMCGKKKCWEEGSEHALGECTLLKGYRQRISSSYLSSLYDLDPSLIYRSITTLRFLSLKERDPSKWAELIKLKRCISSSKLSALDTSFRNEIVPLVNQGFLHVAVPDEYIISILTALAVNTFNLPDFLYVYPIASLFDHSCMANAEHNFGKSGTILVRSTVFITKGSKITLNYCGEPVYPKKALFGTKQRLESLGRTRFSGMCQCQRCCDPTELGTYTSGIFCAQCPNKEGILLPEQPLDVESNWVCNKCPAKKSAAFISNFLENEIFHLVGRDRLSIPRCNAFIRKYGEALHPNHYLLTHLQIMPGRNSALAISDLRENGVIPGKELAERELKILELLALADVISPGLSRLRGILLLNLMTAQTFGLRKSFKAGEIIPDDYDSKLKVLLETSREAHKIFYWGPEIDSTDADFAYETCQCVETMMTRLTFFREHGVYPKME